MKPSIRPLLLAAILSAAPLAATHRAPPTWAGDVARIVHARCAGCHRPAGSAPFPLLTYDDAARRAKRIASATSRGFMPPWLPARSVGEFEGERRLERAEIETLVAWADAGAPEGDPAAAPAPPEFSGDWSLGQPDLVVEFPEAAVPAEGRDVYRNVVVRAPVTEATWIRTVEFLPGNARVVHHAHMMVDTTESSREMAAEDAHLEVMHVSGSAHNPGGFFIGWTPGTSANPGRDDLAWLLTPTTDLVLQLHLRPTGRSETVRARLGLHFAGGPPRRVPALILLESRDIDLQPGDTTFSTGDAFRIPVPVEVLAVYPHAHYLGKRMEGWAVLPNGRRKDLLRIDRWDFNFQDQFRYRSPVSLPAGSLLSMRISFDNSAANPRNPFDPPRRVVRGLGSTDEMAEMGFQVLPPDPGDLAELERSLDAFYYQAELRWEADEHRARARELEAEGRLDEALESYRAALRMGDDARIMASIAAILVRKEDVASARIILTRAWEIADRSGQKQLADSLLAVRRKLEGV